MTNYNLWDMSVWEFFFTLTILFAAMIVANALIRGIKPLRKMLIPASVLGGFLLLIVFSVYRKITGEAMVSSFTLEMLTYHGLGIGCTALALKGGAKEKNAHAQRDIFNSALVTTSTYCLQAVIGLAIAFGLSFVIKSVYAPSGMLVPMGYGQGPGQAYNWGHTYEQSWGFANGTSFGLTVSSVGFIACSIGGVIFLNIMRKKGNPKATSRIGEDVVEEIKVEDFAGPDDVPMSDSLDKLTIECAVVFITYAIAFAFTFVLSKLCDISGVGLLINTVKPLLWGFNFIFAALGALVTKKFISGLEKKQVIKKKYVNDLFMDRIAGIFFDLMIVASISAINLEAFKRPEFVLPLTLMCLAAGVGTYFFVDHATKLLFPTYSEESFLVMYGMLTGVVGTGIILLRQIDPKFETPASNNVVFQTLWACLTGFPLLLLMGFVPQPGWVPISLAILVVGFAAFYLWIRLAAKKVAKDAA